MYNLPDDLGHEATAISRGKDSSGVYRIGTVMSKMSRLERESCIGQCKEMLHDAIGLLLECGFSSEQIKELTDKILEDEQEAQ